MRRFIHVENRSALGSAMGLALAAVQANRQPPETAGFPRRQGGREPRTQTVSRQPSDRA